MKLEDLIAPIINNPGVLPATLGVVLPQTIELPPELHGYFGRTWLESEYNKRQEIGGNLIWVVGDFSDEPVMAAETERGRGRSRSVSDFRSGLPPQRVPGFNPISWSRVGTPGAAPHEKLWTVVKPVDITLGTNGNAVDIPTRRGRANVADFHTHPSTPGGTNMEHCGYQPPSLEDLMGLQHQGGHGKDIFVSFVAVHSFQLYAMVYIRGTAHFDTNTVFAKIKPSLDGKGKRIMFPTDAEEKKHAEEWMKDPPRKRELDDALQLATGYGEKFAKEIEGHLKAACAACGIGLYRGATADSLKRVV